VLEKPALSSTNPSIRNFSTPYSQNHAQTSLIGPLTSWKARKSFPNQAQKLSSFPDILISADFAEVTIFDAFLESNFSKMLDQLAS
jgi:hypothetical protein